MVFICVEVASALRAGPKSDAGREEGALSHFDRVLIVFNHLLDGFQCFSRVFRCFRACFRAFGVKGWPDPEDDRALHLRGHTGCGQHHHRGRQGPLSGGLGAGERGADRGIWGMGRPLIRFT